MLTDVQEKLLLMLLKIHHLLLSSQVISNFVRDHLLFSMQEAEFHQTLIKEQAVDPSDTGSFALLALQNVDQAKDLLVLYQLSIKLLGCEEPDNVVRTSLELLHERMKASVGSSRRRLRIS